jgi:proteasome lid subunit RPN8/RPN11
MHPRGLEWLSKCDMSDQEAPWPLLVVFKRKGIDLSGNAGLDNLTDVNFH